MSGIFVDSEYTYCLRRRGIQIAARTLLNTPILDPVSASLYGINSVDRVQHLFTGLEQRRVAPQDLFEGSECDLTE